MGGEYDDAALDIGMGIRPDLVGQGNGRKYAEAVIAYGVAQYSAQQLRVTIAQFNQRAQRVWARLGFEAIETFTKTSSQERFVIMMRAEA
ncbi:MAG: GNAT family N-acetyltransferase [Elainellaceae cyanobacterium]